MKTAAIFTFQWSDNFGTVLQAYALQTAIQSIGLEATIVPLMPSSAVGIKRFLGCGLHATCVKWRKLLSAAERDRRAKFDSFRKRFFNYGNAMHLSFPECRRHSFKENILVFGSDNIWAPDVVRLGEEQGNVFYGKAISHPAKIAYAVSAGGDLRKNPLKGNVAAEVRASGFKAISCREESTVEALKSCGIEAIHVPDPTLLLDSRDWDYVEDASLCPQGEYYFGYDLGHKNSLSVAQICADLASENGCDFKVCYPNDWRRTISAGCAPSPQQWIALLRHAKGVITNSFHGVMFSVIFSRPFVFVPIEGEKSTLNTRAMGFLSYVGGQERALGAGSGVAEILNRQPEFDCLEMYRSKGFDFLRKNFGLD